MIGEAILLEDVTNDSRECDSNDADTIDNEAYVDDIYHNYDL